MKIHQPLVPRTFTLVDGLFVVAMLLVLLVIFIPVIGATKCKCQRINCVNHLQQVGLAFHIWEADNAGKYPMDIPVSQGGAQEKIATGDVAGCFQVMSNELSTPKIVVCPEDDRHEAATNFGPAFTRTQVSYFLALSAAVRNPQTLLCGDANLVQNDRPVPSGIVSLWTSSTTWTSYRHHRSGNILLPDGSFQTASRIGFPADTNGTYFATNCVVTP